MLIQGKKTGKVYELVVTCEEWSEEEEIAYNKDFTMTYHDMDEFAKDYELIGPVKKLDEIEADRVMTKLDDAYEEMLYNLDKLKDIIRRKKGEL